MLSKPVVTVFKLSYKAHQCIYPLLHFSHTLTPTCTVEHILHKIMDRDTEATEVIVNLSHPPLAEREVCLVLGKDRMERILPVIHNLIQAF